MKQYIEVSPICPFVGKKCIGDGVTRDILQHGGTARPCAFWDGETTYNGVNPEKPCRIQRAIDKILAKEKPDSADTDTLVTVPWGYENKE